MKPTGMCLFEDAAVVDLEPLTLTRPAFDLLCGTTPLADKQRLLTRPIPSAPSCVLI